MLALRAPGPRGGDMPDSRHEVGPDGLLRPLPAPHGLQRPGEHLGRQVVGGVGVPAAGTRIAAHRPRVAPEELLVGMVITRAHALDQLRVRGAAFRGPRAPLTLQRDRVGGIGLRAGFRLRPVIGGGPRRPGTGQHGAAIVGAVRPRRPGAPFGGGARPSGPGTAGRRHLVRHLARRPARRPRGRRAAGLCAPAVPARCIDTAGRLFLPRVTAHRGSPRIHPRTRIPGPQCHSATPRRTLSISNHSSGVSSCARGCDITPTGKAQRPPVARETPSAAWVCS